jgi:hypothetical protein
MTITGYIIVVSFVVAAVYLLLDKYSAMTAKRHTGEVLDGIYNNGKIIYRKKIYVVKDIVEVQIGGINKNKKIRYLIIARGDDSDKVLKLPVEQAVPYVGGKKEAMLPAEPFVKAS